MVKVMKTETMIRKKTKTKLLSVNVSIRNSKAGNGCANYMVAWDFWALSAGEKLHAHKILVLGRVFVFFWGGGVPIYFLWAPGYF